MKVEIININSISFGERAREDYGDIEKLAESIKQHGLIHPIAVRKLEEDHYELLAGGRRLTACYELDMDLIPVRVYERDLSPLMMRSIELEENLQRKDMSWKEQVNLQRQIHELQVAIHGEKIGRSAEAKGQSMADTAEMLKIDPSHLSRNIKLADAVEKFPDVPWDKCKTRADADKMLKQLVNIVDTNVRIDDFNKRTATKQVSRILEEAYVVGDCFEKISLQEDESFDFVEIDPPYAVDYKNRISGDLEKSQYNEIDKNKYDEFMHRLFQVVVPKMSKNSWLVCWYPISKSFSGELVASMEAAGLKVNPLPAVWPKPTGNASMPEYALASSYEVFFYASKGNPKLNKPGRLNWFDFRREKPSAKIHPCERPLELMQEVLKTFAKPNARVLVPFAGSGVTLVAAVEESMFPIGFDLSSYYRDKYLLKLNEGGFHD